MDLGNLVSRVTSAIRKRPSPPEPLKSPFKLAYVFGDGVFDFVEVDPCGIVRIVGWCNQEFNLEDAATVRLDGQPVPFLQHFRFPRPDVPASINAVSSQAGLVLEYLVPETIHPAASLLELDFARTGRSDRFEAILPFIRTHYRTMLSTGMVHHRNQIYGSGPPNVIVDSEVLDLARQLKGPVLDFGCGRGALVCELRKMGTEAHGLELDTEIIRSHTPVEMAKHVTLYDGTLPTPFPDGHFRSVICSEVLEHIPNYGDAVREIARLANEQVIVTVPDSSAIPIGFRHGAVPWHLLEGSHVNFFTQESLKAILQPYFSKIEFGRIGQSRFHESTFYVSLAAVCAK